MFQTYWRPFGYSTFEWYTIPYVPWSGWVWRPPLSNSLSHLILIHFSPARTAEDEQTLKERHQPWPSNIQPGRVGPPKVMIFAAIFERFNVEVYKLQNCKTIWGLRKNTWSKQQATGIHRGLFHGSKLCNTRRLLLDTPAVILCHIPLFPYEKHGWFDLNTSKQHSQRSFVGQAVGLSRVAVKGTVKGREGLSSENGLRNDWPSRNGCSKTSEKCSVPFGHAILSHP